MRALVISERAEADLREIWRWSYGQFGEDQADRYLDQLDDGLEKCGAEPEGGKQRDDSAGLLAEARSQARRLLHLHR